MRTVTVYLVARCPNPDQSSGLRLIPCIPFPPKRLGSKLDAATATAIDVDVDASMLKHRVMDRYIVRAYILPG